MFHDPSDNPDTALQDICKALLHGDEAAWDQTNLIAKSRKSKVALFESQSGVYVIKRYRDPVKRRLQTLGRSARAAREFRALALLRDWIDNPIKPVLWADSRKFGVSLRNIIVTEYVADAFSLKQLRLSLEKHSNPLKDPAIQAQLTSVQPNIAKLAQKIRVVHDKGGQFMDIYDKNILHLSDQSWAIIDQPHFRTLKTELNWRQRAWDLACFFKGLIVLLSKEQRSELLSVYLGRKLTQNDSRFSEQIRFYRLLLENYRSSPIRHGYMGMRRVLKPFEFYEVQKPSSLPSSAPDDSKQTILEL